MATELKEKWAREEELRKKDAEANDLPRVKMSTTQGDMVIELYENEAPDTVGNFVSLVEKKFYDGLPFHRVLPHFMAQGGDPQGDGSGGPGYNIFCECYREDARDHFAGTLSMAHAGKNTGGSQFFLTFQATPHLDGKHTVFGRVIEGKDVLSKITRREPGGLSAPEADRILKAEVIRKRDHEYLPNKTP
ncbi:peptidylprolyl isomerase [Blastopirellula marina]|uniref:Peptidyl-prolyl cis-trans isomerase n=2 Tax=Pirellulales TaxID=2691354 RepID=A0A2S8FH13_9BACT|nr:peptidylprolyl isomerase [Blastopirellula marina]RCS51829.1 peptidylprolyl isomerase [Bremerella cremea]